MSCLLASLAASLVTGATASASPYTRAPATPTPDQATQAHIYFAAGVDAVAAQDFATALAAFQSAARAGLAGPAVQFNIGVSAWELGELDTAEEAFRSAARTPEMAALARYNLGLISLQRGDEQAAAALFTRVRDEATDDSLRRLAMAQLDALSVAARPTAPQRRPLFFLALHGGYDDNVALVADGELLGVSDTESALLETQLAMIAPLPADFRFEASAYLLRYEALEEFDQEGLRLDLYYQRDLGAWRGEIGAGYGLNRLDGERFEDQRGLSLSATRELASRWDLRLRYRYDDIEGRAPFTMLSGDRHEASIRLRQRQENQQLRLEYRFELNDRAGEEVSPDRHSLSAEWTNTWRAGVQGSLGLGWRDSRYSPDGSAWSEQRLVASAGLLGRITRRWEWVLHYDWTRNSASRAELEYRRHRVIAGVQGLF